MASANSSLIPVFESTINNDKVSKNFIKEIENVVALEQIAELAYSDHEAARLLLKDVDTSFVYLKDSVLWLIQYFRQNEIKTEYDLHNKFFNNLQDLIPKAKVVKKKIIREHIPDGFLEINDELYVVEMKLRVFNVYALKQLCRYMRNYNAKGVAVAPKITCELPEDIIFIELTSSD